ncbi:MAG: hypothetical protein R3224_04850, partial [Balneolaceae bacterium]|nr:hypothetical protein [Balneolaceae bacterium]
YHPELSPSLAWKRVFILGLFDGLGITHNRDPMIELGQDLFERRASVNSPEELIELARQRSGFAGSRHGERPLLLRWNRKGCRPPNRPEVRIEQAAELMWRVLATPLDTWFVRAPETLWADLTGRLVVAPGIGEGRSGILYGVVFLPALYLLGSLFRSDRLRHRAFEIWKNYRTGIPPSLFTLYRNSEIPARLYRRKLGAVYQLRHYCRPRRCQDCEVLQQAISS